MAQNPIDEALRKWTEALRRSDSEGLAALMTEDCEFWSPGQPPLIGRKAVAESFRGVLKDYRIEQIFEEQERIEFGDYALLRGLERNIVTPRKGIGETTIQQRVFTLARRDPDGVWRFARGISQFVAP